MSKREIGGLKRGHQGGTSGLQMSKNTHKGAPQDILHDKKPTTVCLSRRFAKRLLVIGISEICRKRLFFPEKDFVLRLAGDMKVKILHPYNDDGQNRNVSKMKRWIQEIIKLTENGWLDKVLITLSAADVPSDDPLEIFAFSLTESTSCRRVDNNTIYKITEEKDKKLQDEAEELLKQLTMQVQSRQELPDNFNFSVQIMTSNYAPKDLMIEDFVSTNGAMTTKSAKFANVFLRREVQTKFHKFRVTGVEPAGRPEDDFVPGCW